jgi:uncharacterized low-complexity protein
MHKSALAVLTLLAGALAANTASPAFAASNASPLAASPQTTITVSCQKGEHAVDHQGRYSCLADTRARQEQRAKREQQGAKREDRGTKREGRVRDHGTRHIKPARHTEPVRHTAPAPSWRHCWFRHHDLWQSPYFHSWNWRHTHHLRQRQSW